MDGGVARLDALSSERGFLSEEIGEMMMDAGGAFWVPQKIEAVI